MFSIDHHIFTQKKACGGKEFYIGIVSQAFLFGYNNDKGDFINQHFLRKRFGGLVLLLILSS